MAPKVFGWKADGRWPPDGQAEVGPVLLQETPEISETIECLLVALNQTH